MHEHSTTTVPVPFLYNSSSCWQIHFVRSFTLPEAAVMKMGIGTGSIERIGGSKNDNEMRHREHSRCFQRTSGQWGAMCLLLILCGFLPETRAQVADECTTHSDCEKLRRPGSLCLPFGDQLKCSNPFLHGCLANHYEYNSDNTQVSQNLIRTCNSDDVENTPYGQESVVGYNEVRVHNGNWESAIFYAWIIQIFLSEFLQVPASVGMSPEDTHLASFYNPEGVMSWSSAAYTFDEVETANKYNGRCDLTDKPCVHIMPEVWIGQEKRWREAVLDGHIDQVIDDGQIGKISWYIPKYTAQRFPEFSTYHGLADNRELLASVFKTPTTFEEYCR